MATDRIHPGGMAQHPGAEKKGAAGTATSASGTPSSGESEKALRAMRTEAGSTLKKKHLGQAQVPPSLEQVMKEVVPEPDGSGPSGAMARIERRMQVMERAFTDIVERHDQSLRDRTDSLATVEQNVSAFGRRLQQSEEYQANIVAELKTAIAEQSMRLNMLELANPAASESAKAFLTPTMPIEPSARSSAESSAVTGEANPGAVSVSKQEAEGAAKRENAYISAARRAATAAHSEGEKRGGHSNTQKSVGNRGRYIILGCMAPVIIGATALFALNRHTVTAEPIRVSMLVPATQTAPKEAAQTPQAEAQAQTATASAQPASTAIPTQPAEPLAQLEEKATGGDQNAARDVGLRYLNGAGVEANAAQAANWLLKASYQGEPTAQYWLATLYARGQGVPADQGQANHWYETAAKAGNARAMHSVALSYLEGWGREKNVEDAARWFAKAAEAGFADAQFNLGVLYERGEGVRKNLADAYTWYAIAAAQGDAPAALRLSVIAKTMPPGDLALAKTAAASFKAGSGTVTGTTVSTQPPGG